MMGLDCGKWRVGVCACYLSFIVRTELVEPSGASSGACGGARRKQFMTKGGGRSTPLTMILSSFLKEVSLRGALLQNMTFYTRVTYMDVQSVVLILSIGACRNARGFQSLFRGKACSLARILL
jgi:hypothetical protein